MKRRYSARLPQFLNLPTSKTQQSCERAPVFSVKKLSNSAGLPQFSKLTTSKTKQFCETSFKNGKLSAKLTVTTTHTHRSHTLEMSKMIFLCSKCMPFVCSKGTSKCVPERLFSSPCSVCMSDIERHPFSQKEISQVCSSKPEILPVIQTCIPTVFPVHPGHLSPKSKKNSEKSVFQVYSECIPSVFQVYSKCVPSVFQMCSKCIPQVQVCSNCIPQTHSKCVPIRLMYSQVYSQEDVHSELAVQFGAGLRQFANTS